MIPLSVLDLAPVPEGADAGRALRNSLDLARTAERLGYRRYWMAEHHSMPGTDRAATYALRRNLASSDNQFPQDVVELMDYFEGREGRAVRAVPGEGLS